MKWARIYETIEDSCMQMYDSPLWFMCSHKTKHVNRARLAGAQLLIVIVCSLAKRALMSEVRGGGEQLRMGVVYVAQEAKFPLFAS